MIKIHLKIKGKENVGQMKNSKKELSQSSQLHMNGKIL